MTCVIDGYLGAYVLHALEPDDAEIVQAHVTGCPACREEVSSLAGTASVLARLTLQDIEELYPAEPAEDGAAPARPRRRRLAVAAAAAVLIAAGTLGGVQVLGGGPVPPPPDTVQVVDPTTHVRAAVTVTGRRSGTDLHLSLAGAGAYPSGWCSLVAHASDGRSQTAATWVANAHRATSVDGATAIPASQLTELDVITATGARLVRITLPAHRN
jgi:anti-sigma factor RsiW